jgi:hypothetical protein
MLGAPKGTRQEVATELRRRAAAARAGGSPTPQQDPCRNGSR